jgi:hypothetical protein
MFEPSELSLDHFEDGGDAGGHRAGVVAGADPLERGAQRLLGKFNIACGGRSRVSVPSFSTFNLPRFGGAFFCWELQL